MLYTIENECLKVTVNDQGAQLMSIRTKADKAERLWQGDATYWGERAPLLFPICGRLTDETYTDGGKTHKMGIHGFLRRGKFTMTEQTKKSIAFILAGSPEAYPEYPYYFVYRITYTLEGNLLRFSVRVVNADDKILRFSLGFHPGFSIPVDPRESIGDYKLFFAAQVKPKKIRLCRGFLAGTDENGAPLLEDFPLDETGEQTYSLSDEKMEPDGTFLANTGDSITLKSVKTGKGVSITYPGIPYIGIWRATVDGTPARFLCLEPWAGLPSVYGKAEDFSSKVAMMKLNPGQGQDFTIALTIH